MESLIREFLHYDEASGLIIWKLDRGKKIKAGSKAGTDNGDGYLSIKFDGKNYKAHRIAWFLKTGEWPVGVIDHINQNRSDNRWENLRVTTTRGNNFNKGIAKNNSSGVTGIRFVRSNRKWRASIRADKTFHHLGYFSTKEAAVKAYQEAKAKLHFVEGIDV